jgi:hypothetical protein
MRQYLYQSFGGHGKLWSALNAVQHFIAQPTVQPGTVFDTNQGEMHPPPPPTF